jgi:hypothetical protein
MSIAGAHEQTQWYVPAALLCSAQAVVDPRGLPLQRLRPQLRAPEPLALSRGCSSTASASRRASARRTVLGRGAAGGRCGRARPGSGCRRLRCRRQGSSRGRRRGRGCLRNLCLAGLEVRWVPGRREAVRLLARVGQQRRRHLPHCAAPR